MMLNRKAFFFVLTPFQYLCAEEARAVFRHRFEECHLVILTASEAIIRQLERIVAVSEWDSVTYREDAASASSGQQPSSLIREVFSRKSIADRFVWQVSGDDTVFLGNIQDEPCSYILKKISPSAAVVVLDDGMATVSYLMNGAQHKTPQIRTLRDLFLWLFWRPRAPERRRLTFFSVYGNLPFSPSGFVQNSFTGLSARFPDCKRTLKPRAVFVGQTMTRQGIIAHDNYMQAVEAVRHLSLRRGEEFAYYAHRAENTSDLPSEWNVVAGLEPLELVFAEARDLPSSIWSFYSSALYNLQLILGSGPRFWFVRPDNEWLSIRHRCSVETVYNYLETRCSTWANVVSLEELARLDADVQASSARNPAGEK